MPDQGFPLALPLRGSLALPSGVRGLPEFIAKKAGVEVIDLRLRPLLNGAVLRHFLLEMELRGGRFAGPQRWVLRARKLTGHR